MSRVLAIWLDGFDMGLADRFELPALSKLASTSACAELHNGTDHLTGLSGEHIATGLSPVDSGRASAVWFEPRTYQCTQRGTDMVPIYGGVPTVVFDPCYFDLPTTPETVMGATGWGAHDPGAPPAARPDSIRSEIEERFGAYPAEPWLYATPWASPERCEQAGDALTRATRARAQAARWLLGERLPNWSLALVGVSEAHSATEALYHGVDSSPRWASWPSCDPAAASLRSVYEEIDGLVAELIAAFPDAVHVVFAPHGMGPNGSDVASMVLLGEVLVRWSGGATEDAAFTVNPDGLPVMSGDESWGGAVRAALEGSDGSNQTPPLARRVAGRLRRGLRRGLRRPQSPGAPLDWMPLTRHRSRWPQMRAFALPSFYDGRVRINVAGREAQGLVDPGDYGSVLDEIEELLSACRDPITGDPVVESFTRPSPDPFEIDPTQADLVVTWSPGVLGLRHRDLGTIGPLPPRRTGGHSSPIGRCLIGGPGIEPADLGTRSSHDVVPTLLHLSGSPLPWDPTGTVIEIPKAGGGAQSP